MGIKLEFSESELAELVSSIQNAPVGGYGKVDKNKEIYSLPTKKLAHKIVQKINAALVEINQGISDATKKSSTNAENIGHLQTEVSDVQTGLSIANYKVSQLENAVTYDLAKEVKILFDTSANNLDVITYSPSGNMLYMGRVSLSSLLDAAKAYTDKELATFDFIKVVSERPEEGLPNKFYLVPKTDGTESDLFDAWVWVNKGTEDSPAWGWEFEGTKKADIDLSVLSEYVKFTDYATASKAGVVKIDVEKGFTVDTNGVASLYQASESDIELKRNLYKPITPFRLDYAVKVGVTTNTETLTDEEKASACDWLGTLKKETATTTKNQVYAKYANGNQAMWNIDNGPEPNTICVRDSGGRLRITAPANGGDCVNLTYFNANNGTKWYKHVMTQSIDMTGDDEPEMVFDWLIVSTRATAYTSAEDVYNSWVAGEIDTFFNSSFGSMKSKTLRIDSNYYAYGISDGGTNIETSYQLNGGTLSYRETIQKL